MLSAPDYVLYDRARRGPFYHRPFAGPSVIMPACGSKTRFQFDPVDESVAVTRYKADRCRRCWR